MPLIIYISHHNGWFDQKDHRKIHDGDIPRLGGIGIFLGWIGGALIVPAILRYTNGEPNPVSAYQLSIFVLGAAVIHFMGLWDDFKNLRPRLKFIIQLVIAGISVAAGLRFYDLAIPFTNITINFAPLSMIISFVWIVGISNAINLIDGMDGQSSVLSIIATLAISIIALTQGNYVTTLIGFALVGGILGFFIFNKPPAKIFMGDSGALFLGYVIAVLPMLQMAKMNSFILAVSISIVMVPIADTIFAMARRIARHKPISTADREHLHHMLLDFGFSNWAILGMVGGYGFVLALIPVVFHLGGWNLKVMHIIMFILWILTFVFIYILHENWRIKIKSGEDTRLS